MLRIRRFPPLRWGGLIEALRLLPPSLSPPLFPPLRWGGLIEERSIRSFLRLRALFPPLRWGGLIEAPIHFTEQSACAPISPPSLGGPH